MNLTVLGSGTAVPHPHRSSSGYWLETENSSVLLDCSASIVHRMAQEDLDWANLDAIWISHLHFDHIGGIAPFLFGTKNAPETQERTKPLKIFGAKDLKETIGLFDEASGGKLFKQPFPVEVLEIEPLEKFSITPDLEAVAMKTPHTDESFAVHLRDKSDKTLVYSGDTGFDVTVATLARNADLFLLECSFVKNKPTEKHLELAEAIHLIRYAKPKRAVLTHFYAEWDNVDFQKEVAEFSPLCEVLEARDGLRLEI
ncbi:MAG TPA: MBL fold metallo-hydrolase [Pyrinomonadaceae bacterium]|jgi:ribonuclease BN (tRNA processing enzyme)